MTTLIEMAEVKAPKDVKELEPIVKASGQVQTTDDTLDGRLRRRSMYERARSAPPQTWLRAAKQVLQLILFFLVAWSMIVATMNKKADPKAAETAKNLYKLVDSIESAQVATMRDYISYTNGSRT